MTKRFTNTDNGFIVDYESKQKVLNLYDVVELLNELATKCSQLEKENEQLKHDAAVLIQSNYDYRRENEILKEWKDNATVEYMKLKNTCNECKKENKQFKKQVDKIDFILEDLNGAEYITRDDAIEALNKIDKVMWND